MIGESVGIFVEGKWFLNEERIHVGDSDDAEAILTEKENISNNKKRCLVNETYSVETAIKLIKLHNKKVTQNVLENCIASASSKSLTNDPVILELRKTGSSISDKYIFVLENSDVVALSVSEIDSLVGLSESEIEFARENKENLKSILRGNF